MSKGLEYAFDMLMNTLEDLDNPDITDEELMRVSKVAKAKKEVCSQLVDIAKASIEAQRLNVEYSRTINNSNNVLIGVNNDN